MSDDVNKSKKGLHINVDSDFEELDRMTRGFEYRGVADAALRKKLEFANTISTLHTEEWLSKFKGDTAKVIQRHKRAQKSLGQKARIIRDTRTEKAINTTTAHVERDFDVGGIESRAKSTVNGVGMQQKAVQLSYLPQRELEERRQRHVGYAQELQKKAVGLAGELYDKGGNRDPQKFEQLQGYYRQRQVHTNQLGMYDAAMRRQRKMGLDEESQDLRRFKAGEGAEKVLRRNTIADSIKRGEGLGALNADQLKDRETEAATKLLAALEELRSAATGASGDLEKLQENADKAAKEFADVQEVRKQGGGGRGAGGGISGMDYARIASVALQVAASTTQEVGVNQQMSLLNSRAGFAQLTNQVYSTRNAAVAGDMTSLLTANTSAAGQAGLFGNKMGGNTETARGLSTGSNIVKGVIGGAKVLVAGAATIKTAGSAAPVAAPMFVSGMNDLSEAIGGTITNTSDLSKNVSKNAARLAGESAAYDLNRAVNVIPGDFMQQFYDYSSGTRNAALMAGGKIGSKMFSDFGRDDGSQSGLLGRLQNARIDPQEYARLMGQGGLEQGSVFDTDQIFLARNAERAGAGTMDMNLGRMTTLAAAGSNNPQTAFASVLEVAFSKSLDSSKSLNMMVQNTADMVKNSAGASALGLDTSSASAEILGRLMVGKEHMPNREAAAERAKAAADRINEMSTSVGANFVDMMAVHKIAMAGGTDRNTATFLKSIDQQTVNAMSALSVAAETGDADAASKLEYMMEQQGLSKGFRNKDGSIDFKRFTAAAKETRTAGVLSQGGMLNLVNPNTVGFDKFLAGDMSPEEIKDKKYTSLRDQLGQAARSMNLTQDELVKQTQSGAKATTAEGIAAFNKLKYGVAPNESADAIDRANTAKAADTANKARQTILDMETGSAEGTIAGIAKLMEQLTDKLTDSTSKEFMGAAADAAQNFKTGSEHFTIAVGNFARAVGYMEEEKEKEAPTQGGTRGGRRGVTEKELRERGYGTAPKPKTSRWKRGTKETTSE